MMGRWVFAVLVILGFKVAYAQDMSFLSQDRPNPRGVTLVSITDAPILKNSRHPLSLASLLDHVQVVSGPEFTSDQMQTSANKYQAMTLNWSAQAKLDTDQSMVARVNTIIRRLVAQTSNFRSDAPAWPWEIHIVDMNGPFASSWPNGKLIISAAMITARHLSDGELAAVIAQTMGWSLMNVPQDHDPTVLRNQAVEADLIGLQLMALAGYDPHFAIELLRRTANSTDEAVNKYSSFYPKLERARILASLLPQVLPLYHSTIKPSRSF